MSQYKFLKKFHSVSSFSDCHACSLIFNDIPQMLCLPNKYSWIAFSFFKVSSFKS